MRAPSDMAELALRQSEEILPIEQDASLGPHAARQQADDGQRQQGFSRTRLPDDAERPAFLEAKAHIGDQR